MPHSTDPALLPADLLVKLPHILDGLERGLIERRQIVRMVFLVAIAGEHSLLIGPPGTAKSELARRLHRAFDGGRYFERLLTRFSVPEELFGPLSISALENDRYERQTAGFLPEASIAFIDEVFKANSAILNALLTLLNEREFDNGAGRQRCPLISVIGATNSVPADEVGEAFFDRFLARLPVAPVSADGFAGLLKLPPEDPESISALDHEDLARIAAVADAVFLPDAVVAVLSELRSELADGDAPVSDRRWVKIVRLLKTAAACDRRAAVSLWHLALLPPCLAPDAASQARVGDWLAERLAVGSIQSPARLTRIVEAFEAQLEIEHNAEDLQYDSTGRLQFSDSVSEALSDAKGGDSAPRLSYTRRRRYGPAHIAARVSQIDDLLQRIARYQGAMANWQSEFEALVAASLWLDPAFVERARACLGATAASISALAQRTRTARAGFLGLPTFNPAGDPPGDLEPPGDGGDVPEPVAHEAFDE